MVNSCRLVFLLLLLALAPRAHAQYAEVRIGVDGLTCSQCTRSVEMHLRRLDMVKEVRMNLEHTNGVVILDPTKRADLSRLAKAVKDAGFSVRYVRVPITVDPGSNCVTQGKTTYQLIGDEGKAGGLQWVQVLGADLMSRKEWRRWEPLLKNKCGTTGGKLLFVAPVNEDPS